MFMCSLCVCMRDCVRACVFFCTCCFTRDCVRACVFLCTLSVLLRCSSGRYRRRSARCLCNMNVHVRVRVRVYMWVYACLCYCYQCALGYAFALLNFFFEPGYSRRLLSSYEHLSHASPLSQHSTPYHPTRRYHRSPHFASSNHHPRMP